MAMGGGLEQACERVRSVAVRLELRSHYWRAQLKLEWL